jgi:hypothetical protein
MESFYRLMHRLVLLAACLSMPAAAAPDDTADPGLQEKLKLYRQFEPNLDLPLTGRVQAVPDDFLQSIIAFDKSIGIRNTDYKARVPAAEETAIFAEYLKLLPERYQVTFSNKLLAVYFIDNFAGAGLTDWLIDKHGDFYYYMILNSALLTESLDGWLTYRENSFFAEGSPFSIKVRTGTEYKALLYGFLHEGGHIVDIEYRVTPYIDPLHRKITGQESEVSAFTRGVWAGQKTPVARYNFNNRDRLNVYGIFDRERVPGVEMQTMFLQLHKTPFVSFYAGTAWYEDFADFITYHHIVRNLGGSISVELYEGARVIKKFSPAKRKMGSERKRIMRDFIK